VVKESLLFRNVNTAINGTPAQVIPIWPVFKENVKQKERISKIEAEKKMLLFYTEPIFKSKKHDFL
jgi:hypothetical protein